MNFSDEYLALCLLCGCNFVKKIIKEKLSYLAKPAVADLLDVAQTVAHDLEAC